MILGTTAVVSVAAHKNNNNNNNVQPVVSQVVNSSNDTGAATITKLAIVNFDDGYKSQFTSAKPILVYSSLAF